jgi:plastocyanin
MHARSALFVGVLAAVAAACGSSSSPAPAPAPQGPGFFITISNLAFSPADLRVPPGATVTVLNGDGMPHSVTSEAHANDFTPGAVGGISFDTGAFTGTKTFTIPSGAAANTVVPYYCTVHKGTMATPNASLTIDPSAVPTTAPGGSGGGAGPGGGGGGGGGGY